ncbi:MAG: glycosyltransferase family 39 protein [Chitinophagales bacterium]|nr:glycosyltransferase family 39 protein [Chitinophagales bacterium]
MYSKKLIPAIFFSAALLIGIISYKTYGIPYDEPVQRDLGLATWAYIQGENDSLLHLINKFHDAAYEVFLTVPEKIFHLQTGAAIYHSRHFINYLIFWIGSIFFFLLAKKIFINHWLSLLPVGMLYLTPRIFAHAFYNSKDIPLMVFFIISIYCMVIFLDHPSFKNVFLFALASGFLLGLRVVGIIVPAFAVIFFLWNLIFRNNELRNLKYLLWYFLLFVIFSYAFYPVLWKEPITNAMDAFTIMSHYPFDTRMLFMGKMISPLEVPWYYIPVWMGITIPLFWQVVFIAGISLIVFNGIKSVAFLNHHWKIILLVAWLFIPWLMVVLLHSTIYDEWRHLFFIYPAFLLIAVFGIREIWMFPSGKHPLIFLSIKVSFFFLLIWQIMDVASFMIRNHPHEYVYFNALAGNNVGTNYELDYWGLSYREALEYLVQHDKSREIKACWQNAPGYYNLSWLSPAERSRIHELPYDSCKYFLTNYRLHPDQYAHPGWYTVKVNNLNILTVEKLH